uniref:Uncharacterized protein n=1 Tax=Molossus molossus TaxID=27622 RepID=A0A7J8BJB5_MOLMO|nr:hypothetical protein HJG59_010222 [Molossus molossus]
MRNHSIIHPPVTGLFHCAGRPQGSPMLEPASECPSLRREKFAHRVCAAQGRNRAMRPVRSRWPWSGANPAPVSPASDTGASSMCFSLGSPQDSPAPQPPQARGLHCVPLGSVPLWRPRWRVRAHLLQHLCPGKQKTRNWRVQVKELRA